MISADYSVYFSDVLSGSILEKQWRKEKKKTVAKEIKQKQSPS